MFLSRGYFPKELPPPFRSSSFARIVQKNLATLPGQFGDAKNRALTVSYNMARVGILRRELGVPNPINYYRLSREILDNWKDLRAHYAKGSFSESEPRVTKREQRAFKSKLDLAKLPELRARLRTSGRYLLRADVTRCYPSIYTHSIPWALHTKPTAKKDTSDALLGNRLDKHSRNLQDRQTVGLPIGPDGSFVLSEIVLTGVDLELPARLFSDGYRYIDDFEFSFPTLAAAEEALGALQYALDEYELELNGRKTEIVELPQPLDKLWASELRLYELEQGGSRRAEYKLLGYFDRAFDLARQYKDEYVLSYAIARLGWLKFEGHVRRLLQNLLLQSAIAEPATLNRVTAELLKNQAAGLTINKDRLEACLDSIIQRHSPLGHHSEVAWALWATILFEVRINKGAANLIAQQSNSMVALLALDARARGLFPRRTNIGRWSRYAETEELYGEEWLLAYEANKKGWIKTGKDYVKADPCFAYLKAHNVSFYNRHAPTSARFLTRKLRRPVVFASEYPDEDDSLF
jgi:hypothetical protein